MALSIIAGVRAAGPAHVDITWLSISSIYYELVRCAFSPTATSPAVRKILEWRLES